MVRFFARVRTVPPRLGVISHFCCTSLLAGFCLYQPFSQIACSFFFIVGGLYSVTALRENDQERVTVYTKHRLKLHSQTTPTNDGDLKNLDTRGDG